MLEHREYPPTIRDTLGEAVAASVLLAATLKFDGTLSLQLQGRGPLRLLLAQCSSQLGVRAVARYREAGESRDLADLLAEGHLTVTLENDDLSQRYQGVVPLAGKRLAQCLDGYFENSEQLPTRLWLHATPEAAAGLLLQRLPDDSLGSRPWVGDGGTRASSGQHASAAPADIDDAWQRVQLLGDTLQPHELQSLTDRDILRRLFAEDDVRLFEPAPVFFRCRCSRERVVGMLRSLGIDEVRSVLAERGSVEVRCDFCNRAYQFDRVDAERLFAHGASEGSERRH